MQSRTNNDKTLLIVNTAVFLILAAGWLLYLLVGHRLIEAIYSGPWIQFLHKAMMMEGQSILSLEHYFRGAQSIMWSATMVGTLVLAAANVMVKSPSSIVVSALSVLFLGFALLASAIAFFYPLEIETREGTVWLDVLALSYGINIYDHSQVAFINQNHGPFDPLFKLSIAALLPFLESWQVSRVSVLLLPYAFLLVAWKWLGKNSRSFVDVFYLGSIGYLFLIVSAKEFIFVGRSDATAALLLLPLMYFSVTSAPATYGSSVRAGAICGALGLSVILTNWRMLPVVFALFLFALWMLRSKQVTSLRMTASYVAGCACSSVVIFALLLYYWFQFDLALYYKYFFGVYSEASGHGHRTYGHASFIWFLGSLLNPFATVDNLKGGPMLWALAIYLLIPGKLLVVNRAWFLLGAFIFVGCTAAYFFNYYGGGQWYYIPFVMVLWFFLCANYGAMAVSRRAAVGLVIAILIIANAGTVITPSFWRVATFAEARVFMGELRSLEADHRIVSEDMFFFRTSYQGELIDMGDMISRVRKSGHYYGEEFERTVDRHFERVIKNPPDYVVTGFTESPELRLMAEERYVLVARGPGNLTANGFKDTKLYRRKDLPALRQSIVEPDMVSLPAKTLRIADR